MNKVNGVHPIKKTFEAGRQASKQASIESQIAVLANYLIWN
jgi:hypothetical protein